MAYFMKLTVWCEYSEEAYYLKFDENDFSSQSEFEKILEEEGADAAHNFAEDYEYLIFGWDFNLDEAIDSGELTEADYDEIISDYYNEAGYHWEFVSEEEYLDNQKEALYGERT